MMKLGIRIFTVIILGVFWGIIGLSMVTGMWETKVSAEDIVVAEPGDIKGWMNLEDISGYFGIPAEELVGILGLPPGTDFHTPIKDLAEDNEWETSVLREKLNQHLGLPASAENGARPEQEVVPDYEQQAREAAESGSDEDECGSTGETIRGRMTLREVEVVTGVPAVYICRELGIPVNVDINVPIRDLGMQYGFEVAAVREIAAGYGG